MGRLSIVKTSCNRRINNLAKGSMDEIDSRDANSVLRKMSISENYEGSVTPIRSDISTFSRGTVGTFRQPFPQGHTFGNSPGSRR